MTPARTTRLSVAHGLGDHRVSPRSRNFGYGANQKTCYAEALKTQHGIVVMLHPDYQYDPTLLPTLIEPILARRGRRRLRLAAAWRRARWRRACRGGSTYANRALTWLRERGLRPSPFRVPHGLSRVLATKRSKASTSRWIPTDFVFDQEIVAQFVNAGFRIAEVPVPDPLLPRGLLGELLAE